MATFVLLAIADDVKQLDQALSNHHHISNVIYPEASWFFVPPLEVDCSV